MRHRFPGLMHRLKLHRYELIWAMVLTFVAVAVLLLGGTAE